MRCGDTLARCFSLHACARSKGDKYTTPLCVATKRPASRLYQAGGSQPIHPPNSLSRYPEPNYVSCVQDWNLGDSNWLVDCSEATDQGFDFWRAVRLGELCSPEGVPSCWLETNKLPGYWYRDERSKDVVLYWKHEGEAVIFIQARIARLWCIPQAFH